MIIDKKGRLFGKISIIDLIIILIAIAVLIVGVRFLISKKAKAPMPGKVPGTVYYTLEVKNVNEQFIKELEKGDKVFNAIRNNELGVIDSIKTEKYSFLMRNFETGTFEKVFYENRYNAYIRVKADAKVDVKHIHVGEQLIRVGTGVAIKSKGIACNTWIVELELVEDEQ